MYHYDHFTHTLVKNFRFEKLEYLGLEDIARLSERHPVELYSTTFFSKLDSLSWTVSLKHNYVIINDYEH